MPGLFGVVGSTPEAREQLADAFAAIWPTSQMLEGVGHVLGAHRFGPEAALAAVDDGRLVAIDGESDTYRRFSEALSLSNSASQIESAAIDRLRDETVGNVTIVDPVRGRITLSTDPSGTFPLYYCRVGDGLAFCSLTRPLAALTNASTNHHAVRQYLRQAWIVGEETVFHGVHRLLPGQTLRFEQGGSPVITEGTTAWIRGGDREDECIESVWHAIESNAASAMQRGPYALMMSGGWDSRTLLAAISWGNAGASCYSHGDMQSRELQLVRELCDLSDIACRLEPLDDRMFEAQLLADGFNRTESLSFPHWHLAGQLLQEGGTHSVSAGILGEIIGGHYGPTMIGSNLTRARTLLSTLVGSIPSLVVDRKLDPRQMLSRSGATSPWYLEQDYAQSLSNEAEHYNGAIEAELDRHTRRGVTDPSALIEAFITEQRGSQYIAAQLRSCRAHLDVCVPYASRAAFVAATQLPLSHRIHNRLSRELLRRHAPTLLQLPMAATLVSARRSILLQEASRAVRKLGESAWYRARKIISPDAVPPRLGWVDFEFLSDSRALHELIESLEQPFWNRSKMADRVDRRVLKGTAHPIFDQFMKIKTLDLLLSPSPIRSRVHAP